MTHTTQTKYVYNVSIHLFFVCFCVRVRFMSFLKVLFIVYIPTHSFLLLVTLRALSFL